MKYLIFSLLLFVGSANADPVEFCENIGEGAVLMAAAVREPGGKKIAKEATSELKAEMIRLGSALDMPAFGKALSKFMDKVLKDSAKVKRGEEDDFGQFVQLQCLVLIVEFLE